MDVSGGPSAVAALNYEEMGLKWSPMRIVWREEVVRPIMCDELKLRAACSPCVDVPSEETE